MSQFLKFNLEPSALPHCKFVRPRPGDAGYDICSSGSTTIFNGTQGIVMTGLRVAIPKGYVGLIKDRSSMAIRQIYTHAGVIDSSFRGAITVLMQNDSKSPFHIEPGDRIAQLVIVPVLTIETCQVNIEDLGKSERGEGSFGSTGK